jgi:type III secretory pathway lipoprotein EscJ
MTIFGRLFLLLSLVAPLVGCGGSAVVSDLEQDKAMSIAAKLQAGGIRADKAFDEESGLYAVRVPSADKDRATKLIEELGLLDKSGRTFEECLKAGPMFSGSEYQRQCRITGLETSVVESLTAIPGVVSATVTLVVPEKKTFGSDFGNREKSKASVVIEYQNVDSREPVTVRQVQELVSHSVEGLSTESVEVQLYASSLVSQPVLAGSADVVDFAGVRVDRSSVGQLKILAVITGVLFAVFGALLFLGGRANDQLRLQIETLERQLKNRQIKRPAEIGSGQQG